MGAVNAPDVEILDYAAANGFTVLAQDLDFGAILAGDELGSPRHCRTQNRRKAPRWGLNNQRHVFSPVFELSWEYRKFVWGARKDSMTNQQLYLAIGVPMLFNAILIGLLVGYINAKFDGVNQRFNDMRDLWRAELRRVEEVLDARLKHLEEYAKH